MKFLLRVQRYVNDINKIIDKTGTYARELGISGKYLKRNIENNIRNYLEMMKDIKGFSKEELIIIIKEFNEYLDFNLLEEYLDQVDSLKNMTSSINDESDKNIHNTDLT